MLIEIHIIQNHSPANLNRDDLGAPKTCIFGGVTRARISSQCLKRSIRRSPEFAAALENGGGVRTRRLAAVLARIAESIDVRAAKETLARRHRPVSTGIGRRRRFLGHAEINKDYELTPAKLNALCSAEVTRSKELDKLEELASAALELGGVKPKGKKKPKNAKKDDDAQDDDKAGGTDSLSKMLVFLSTDTIKQMAKDLSKASDAKALAETYKGYVAGKPCVPDIALCGRMTEVAKGGLFVDCDFTVEAALSAAHAISTHAIVNEVDYFTAADDIPGSDAGAGHVNEAVFNSACFYKHFSIDWNQLLRNLGSNADLASLTVRCFLEAAARANPSGKQHAYAAFNPPDGILVEVKSERATPISYANAFADPVPQNAQRGLIGESIARLGQYVHEIAGGYGITADRFWFSPSARHALTYVDRKEQSDAKKEKPLISDAGNEGDFGKFVERVMRKVKEGQTAGAAS